MVALCEVVGVRCGDRQAGAVLDPSPGPGRIVLEEHPLSFGGDGEVEGAEHDAVVGEEAAYPCGDVFGYVDGVVLEWTAASPIGGSISPSKHCIAGSSTITHDRSTTVRRHRRRSA
jgi:hypothetical protein